jgi:hypothetical protein
MVRSIREVAGAGGEPYVACRSLGPSPWNLLNPSKEQDAVVPQCWGMSRGKVFCFSSGQFRDGDSSAGKDQEGFASSRRAQTRGRPHSTHRRWPSRPRGFLGGRIPSWWSMGSPSK